MIVETTAAFNGIRGALDIAKGINALKTEVERNQAVIDIQRALLDAQSGTLDDKQKMSELSSRIAHLESELAQKQQWEDEKNRYALTQSQLGAYTYDLKPELANGEVSHRLCANCYGDDKKSILHVTVKHSGGEIVECGKCKSKLQLSNFVHNPINLRNVYDDLNGDY